MITDLNDAMAARVTAACNDERHEAARAAARRIEFEAAFSKGSSGGGSAPTEDANTLQSKAVARVVDLISEGEIVGLYTGEGAEGKDNPLKAVYLNNIPVMDADGNLNYEGLTMVERTGLPDQAVIPEFPEVESEITVNQQVEDASPVLFIVADDDVDAIRLKLRIPALYEQISSGSLVASTLNFIVEVQPYGGSFTEIINDTVNGKNTSTYERQHYITLGDKGAFPLTFKVSRVTPDSDKASKQQDLYVNSYTEVQEVQLTYPDSALIAITVDSELFSGRVPSRSFFVRGIKIQVPSNYFPETGFYNRDSSDGSAVTDGGGAPVTQVWDGTLWRTWSNNPAWVLFDILSNERYGLGEFIDEVDQIDRYSLYEIGVYCDELVDTGLGDGTQERRFVFNGVINTREDAYDVVNAITSTFRGMSYWSAAGVTAVADSPKDPKRVITRANITGEFNYAGTALKAQHSAALVSYSDPTNNYKQTIEVVEDPVRRERYGWREIEVVAFATTSRGQAYRLGRFILFSEALENETLTFTGTFDLSDLRPGDVINVADPARQGLRAGGRIVSYTAGTPGVIVIDSELETYDGDSLLVRTVEGGMESLNIEATGMASSTMTLKSGEAPTANLQPNSIFVHRGQFLVPETWRVLSCREAAPDKWEFACLTYDETKFAAIEANIFLEAPPTSFLPTGPLVAPNELTVFESLEKVGSAVNVVIDISWKRSVDPRATLSLVEFRFRPSASDPDGNWQLLTQTTGIHAVIPSGQAGLWSFRVIGMNSDGIAATSRSAPLLLTDYEIIGKTAPPPNVTNLTAVRGFDEVVLDWDDVDDIDLSGYEVRRGSSWDGSTINPVEILASLLFASTYTATVRTAAAQTYHVRAVDTLGNYSREVRSITTSIQALPAVANLYAHQVDDSLRVDWDSISGTENINYEIRYGSTSDTFARAVDLARVATSNYLGPLPVNAAQTTRIWVRAYVVLADDSFSYGTETYIDAALFPLNRGLRVLSRTEEPGWSSNVTDIEQAFLLSGIELTASLADGDLINPVLNANYLSAQTPEHVSRSSDAAFHCNLRISSAGLPVGTLMEMGDDTDGGLFVGFDDSGNLIARAGRSSIAAVSETSLIHSWMLNETSGTRYDAAGSNDLADGGTVISTDGYPGNGQDTIAAEFVSWESTSLSGGSVGIATGPFTIVFWVRFNSNSGNDEAILSIGSGATGAAAFTSGIHLMASIQVGKRNIELRFNTTGTSPSMSFTPDGEDEFEIDRWYMVAIVRDSVDDVRAVVDGVLAATLTPTPGATINSTAAILLGDGYAHLTGDLDDVRIWTRELSDAELLVYFQGVANGLARIEIANASLPTDTDFDLFWDVKVGDQTGSQPGRVRVWVDGTLTSQECPEGLSFITEGSNIVWSSTAEGKYNGVSGTTVLGEEGSYAATLNGNVTLNSDLKYWRSQLIIQPLAIEADELTLAEGATYGRYEFPFALPGVRIGRLWAEVTASSIAADPLEIFDALMEINDATFDIAESNPDYRPQFSIWIDLDDTGTFIPLVPATYQFTTATIRIDLTRGENETTRPSISNLSVHFIEQPPEITLQAETTDATKTTLTYDGGAVSASNIPIIPDDFMARIDGRMIAWKNDNSERAQYTFSCILKRGTGVASTTVESFEIIEDEDDEDWLLELEPDTTYGGLQVNFTGKASTTIKSLCDVNITKVGS